MRRNRSFSLRRRGHPNAKTSSWSFLPNPSKRSSWHFEGWGVRKVYLLHSRSVQPVCVQSVCYSSVHKDAGFVRKTLKFCDGLNFYEFGPNTGRRNWPQNQFLLLYILRKLARNLSFWGDRHTFHHSDCPW